MRGLKLCLYDDAALDAASHPLRVRGLKPEQAPGKGVENGVAPLAGAWIETLIK